MIALVAFRQLQRSRRLAIAGMLGIAASLLLIVMLDAILAGTQERLTEFLVRSDADVVIAQGGVTTMHMTESALPPGIVRIAARTPGVRDAVPTLYASTKVQRGFSSGLVYLLGQRPGDRLLIDLSKGLRPERGEIAIDQVLAHQLGAEIGDRVDIAGRDFTVSGLVSGTASIVSSTAIANEADMRALLRIGDSTSYVFVRSERGTDQADLVSALEARLTGVSVTAIDEFVESERRVVSDMLTDIIRAMNVVGLVIGVTVTGLIGSATTRRQLRDVAVLRAIGAGRRRITALVLTQVGIITGIAAAVALTIAYALAALLPSVVDTLPMRIEPGAVAFTVTLVAGFCVAGSLVPIVQIVRVDPASSFHR